MANCVELSNMRANVDVAHRYLEQALTAFGEGRFVDAAYKLGHAQRLLQFASSDAGPAALAILKAAGEKTSV